MTITLPTNVVAGNTGHINAHNIVHLATNGLIYNDGAGTFWIPATSVSDTTAGHLMWASARGAASGVASLDGSTLLPAAQLPAVTLRRDQDNVLIGLADLHFICYSSPLTGTNLYMGGSRGTVTVPAALQSGDNLASLLFQGQYDTTVGNRISGARIKGVATENFAGTGGAATNSGTKIQIWTTPTGTTGVVLALTIDQDQSATLVGALNVGTNITLVGTVSGATNVLYTDGTVSTTTVAGGIGAVRVRATSGAVFLTLQRDNGAAIGNGVQLGSLIFAGSTDNASTMSLAGIVRGMADAAWSGTSSPARIEILTVPTGSLVAAVRVGVNQAGLLYVGTTAAAAVASIDQSGNAAFTGITSLGSAAQCTISATGAISTSSSITTTGTGALVIAGTSSLSGNVTLADAVNIIVNATTGTKIGTATTQKIGFWNVAPVAQYSTTGTSTGFTAGAGTAVTHLSTFTGNTGATAYTIADLVRALKLCGIVLA